LEQKIATTAEPFFYANSEGFFQLERPDKKGMNLAL
jgi:hypothetical protein